MSYTTHNVGADARCTNCGGTIRLPGKLATVAAIHRERRTDRAGLALELSGFAMMFFLFPWGFIAGGVLVFFGWRKTNALVCSNCHTIVPKRTVEACPGCRSKFGSD